MVLVQVVNVLARDDVDLGVPVAVQFLKHCQLSLLLVTEVREILQNLFHACKGTNKWAKNQIYLVIAAIVTIFFANFARTKNRNHCETVLYESFTVGDTSFRDVEYRRHVCGTDKVPAHC